MTAPPIYAQLWDRLTNPKVTVQLKHPPGLGLNVARVAFGPAKGDCSAELVDAVVEDFVNNGVDVVDREHLETILQEHDFSLSEYVDASTASRLGQILGPAALIFLRIQRCVTEEDELSRTVQDREGRQHLRYISRTQVFYKASIQTVDLATGRIFAAKTFDADQTEKYESDRCCPEHPSAHDLTDRAVRKVAEEIHRMFFAWVENRDLHFFNDKDCGLKVAHQLLAVGDVEGALRQSEANLEVCRSTPGVKPKLMSHAVYNVGMAHFVAGHHDRALEYFGQANSLGGGNIVAEGIGECRRAQQLATELLQFEERAQVEAEVSIVASAASRPSNPEVDQSATAAGLPTGESVEERLTKLQTLFQKGLLTQDEFNSKKAKILEEL